jgi:hypothetical protein
MKIEVYKTFELTEEYWKQIISGFNASFEEQNMTMDQLKTASKSNSFGYSYHSLCITEDKEVIGFNSIAPNYYLKANNIKIKVGLSGSTYVLKEYRKDVFIFHDMYMALKDYCKNEGLIVFLGVPNMNSYLYSIKFLKCKEVFSLPYYAFPKNIFSVVGKGKFSVLNIFSNLFSLLILLSSYVVSFFANTKERIAKYRIFQDENYLTKRFQAERYKTISDGNISFSYVKYCEDSIDTIYLMNFSEKGQKSYKALVKAILYIYKKERFDLIIYVGTMNLKQYLLLKVPKRFEPKKLPFTYNLLKIENISDYEDMGVEENWDFSLMNLDVR